MELIAGRCRALRNPNDLGYIEISGHKIWNPQKKKNMNKTMKIDEESLLDISQNNKKKATYIYMIK